MGIEQRSYAADAGRIIDLFELDAMPVGGSIYRFHAGATGLGADVTWQGKIYTRYPIEAAGFERNGSGKSPRPTLSVSNISGLFGAVLRDYDDLVGCKVTRRRTLREFLDASNFPEGNPEADPTAAFPDEVYYINRKTAQNPFTISFELAAAWDLAGVRLPRRQIIASMCAFTYRGAECGYAGPDVADVNDVAVPANAAYQIMSQHTPLNGTWYSDGNYSTPSGITPVYYFQGNGGAGASFYQDHTRGGTTENTGRITLRKRSGTGMYANFVLFWFTGGATQNVTLQVTFDTGVVVTATTGATLLSYEVLPLPNDWYTLTVSGKGTDAANTVVRAQVYIGDLNGSVLACDPYFYPQGAFPNPDRCGKRLSSCKIRFGGPGGDYQLPFGGFPSAGLFR